KRAETRPTNLLQASCKHQDQTTHITDINHNSTVDKLLKHNLQHWCTNQIDELMEKGGGNPVQVGRLPQFNIYGNDGYANKYDGKVFVYPGFEGGGSVDAEIRLSSSNMRALEGSSSAREGSGSSAS
ncbi:BAHD acyltransferase DCR, partial [Bienertia sinuspersici]